MVGPPRALPTYFCGIRFKSRLEARWAFYFWLMDWEWQYEPEGYSDGRDAYCPDFLIRTVNMLAEVKPTLSCFDDPQVRAKIAVAVVATGLPLIMLGGLPDMIAYPVLWGDGREGEVVLSNHRGYPFIEHRLYAEPGDIEHSDWIPGGMFDDVPDKVEMARTAEIIRGELCPIRYPGRKCLV